MKKRGRWRCARRLAAWRLRLRRRAREIVRWRAYSQGTRVLSSSGCAPRARLRLPPAPAGRAGRPAGAAERGGGHVRAVRGVRAAPCLAPWRLARAPSASSQTARASSHGGREICCRRCLPARASRLRREPRPRPRGASATIRTSTTPSDVSAERLEIPFLCELNMMYVQTPQTPDQAQLLGGPRRLGARLAIDRMRPWEPAVAGRE